jgi:hypothetical protein
VGTRNYRRELQLEPDGKYKLEWTLQPGTRWLDVSAIGETYTTTTANARWWTDEAKPKVEGHHYAISGEFQGEMFYIDAIDLINDSPVEAVMREVIGLADGDELVSVAVRHADGTVTVRPWDEG